MREIISKIVIGLCYSGYSSRAAAGKGEAFLGDFIW